MRAAVVNVVLTSLTIKADADRSRLPAVMAACRASARIDISVW
jgi:hypothetical protein